MMTKVIVVMVGGVIQSAFSHNPNLELEVLDWDDEEEEGRDDRWRLFAESNQMNHIY